MDSITTLIVEDEVLLAEILADAVKQFPQYQVVGVAESMEKARKMIRLYQPMLILLDNFLPDGKGIDLIRYTVSTRYQGRIIFITADNHMETISEALRLAVFDYLIKPLHFQRLQQTLARFARYRSSIRSNEQASQTHVDALFNIQSKEPDKPATVSRGGIEEATMNRVLACFTPPLSMMTADTLARHLGSSKTTARRYLEQGVKDNHLEAEINYGKVGRPERVYRLKPVDNPK